MEVDGFYIIYWIIFLASAVSFENLLAWFKALVPAAETLELKNKLYCMQLAGWITRESYSGKEYFYACQDIDPFEYAYKENVDQRDSVRRKMEVARALQKAEQAPLHIRKIAAKRRGTQ